MLRLLVIGLGGFIGSIFRYLLSGYVQAAAHSFEFPYGTLTVNVLGCFVLGFLAQLADGYGMFTAQTRMFLFVGILGGFTTFSTFGNESYNLLRDSEHLLATVNIATHVILGLAAIWAGRSLVHLLWR